MINIDTKNTETAENKHYEGLKDLLIKRIDDYATNDADGAEEEGTRQRTIPLNTNTIQFLKDNLEKILIGSIDEIKDLNEKLKNLCLDGWDSQKERIINIFSYSWFIDKKKTIYDAYDLASNLKIPVCPYCNIEYTTTIVTANQEKICRPAFDHYLPKSEYPLLALSFYNLIPSCTVCNSTLKGKKEFELDKDLHPYRDHVLTDFRFSYSATGIEDIKIKVEKREKIEGEESLKIDKTFETFKIEERYNAHKEIAQDLIDLKRAYSEDFFFMLNKAIPSAHLSPEDAYRVFIGSYPDEGDFYKRPFSKLKHDVAEDLGLIKKK